MPVKIRLARRGRKKQPYYHIIVADSRAPRDGRFIEKIGSYNPMTKPATINLDRQKAFEWLMKGAQPTDTARAILRFKGVLYKKHLQRGVQKGAMSQEEADKKFQSYIDAKEAKVQERREESIKERQEFLKAVYGSVKQKPVDITADSEAQAKFQEKAGELTTEETSPSEESSVEEITEAAGSPETSIAAEETASAESSSAEQTAVEESGSAEELESVAAEESKASEEE